MHHIPSDDDDEDKRTLDPDTREIWRGNLEMKIKALKRQRSPQDTDSEISAKRHRSDGSQDHSECSRGRPEKSSQTYRSTNRLNALALAKAAKSRTDLTDICSLTVPFKVTDRLFNMFQEVSSASVEIDGKTELVIEAGDDVYIPHLCSSTGRVKYVSREGNDHWICRVLSIREWKESSGLRLKKSPRWWIKVRWFCTPRRAESMIPKHDRKARHVLSQLANAELLLSNEESIIPVNWVEANDEVVDFDDTSYLSPTHIAHNKWFWRFALDVDTTTITGITRHCRPGCQNVYDITTDSQRYCNKCSTWYDVECLKALTTRTRPILPPFTLKALSRTKGLPISRGHGISEDLTTVDRVLPEANIWQTAGNGKLLELIRSWRESEVPVESWKGRLKQVFLDGMNGEQDENDITQAEMYAAEFVKQMMDKERFRIWYTCIGAGCSNEI